MMRSAYSASIVEEWLSPVWAQRSYGGFRRGRAHSRGRLVQVDYRRSLTARKADEWLAVSADSQMFLAYGLMSVLLREDGGILDDILVYQIGEEQYLLVLNASNTGQDLAWLRGHKPLDADELKELDKPTRDLAERWGNVYGAVT